MRACLTLLLAFSCSWAVAGLIPEKDREQLIERVLKNFWGRAKLSNGQLAQPSSEEERNTVPISKPLAYRAIDAGEISGLGEWCSLDWQPHYLSLTKAARAKKFNDKQVAFVSFLHGAAQGIVATAMKDRPCAEGDRAKVENYLRQSKERGLAGT